MAEMISSNHLFSPDNPLNNFANFLRDDGVAIQLLLVKRKIITLLGRMLSVSEALKDLPHHYPET